MSEINCTPSSKRPKLSAAARRYLLAMQAFCKPLHAGDTDTGESSGSAISCPAPPSPQTQDGHLKSEEEVPEPFNSPSHGENSMNEEVSVPQAASYSPVSEPKEKEWAVESILDKGLVDKQPYYLIKWEGFPEKEATWEPERNLTGCMETLAEFNRTWKESRKVDKSRKAGPGRGWTRDKLADPHVAPQKRESSLVDDSGVKRKKKFMF